MGDCPQEFGTNLQRMLKIHVNPKPDFPQQFNKSKEWHNELEGMD